MHTTGGRFIGFRDGTWYFVNPFGRTSLFPEDGTMNLTMTWDDARFYLIEFYPLEYGAVHRYRGRALPATGMVWRKCDYLPPLELELLIVRMAARGVRFRDIRKRIGRPRWELAAILNWHGYPGLSHASHGDGEGWEFMEQPPSSKQMSEERKGLGTETPI